MVDWKGFVWTVESTVSDRRWEAQNFVRDSNPLIGFQHSVLLFSAIFASFNAFWPGHTVHSLLVAPPDDFFCASASPLVLYSVGQPASRSDS
ncbi:hypothetical protein VC83_03158 [Pseudogymnoascus destructans]|uniref:Uncharacterized protein n=1 Tax=Pseudogymnoascus destructans TaxID=655981 RepID=A0A177ADR0_9PEZI|nr:uncharacterized protein VC83_03158 [Pseudogymnoascus destructans]OAF60207.1 hypothetical protein VC83_03158 [Pseudogymnoascus destructans]